MDASASPVATGFSREQFEPMMHCCPWTIRVERRANGEASSAMAIDGIRMVGLLSRTKWLPRSACAASRQTAARGA
jgi:hypothetical protein